MEVKPGYKQTEVGVIPKEWEVSIIGHLCAAVLDCHHSTPVWTASGSIVIRNQNIRDGKLDLSQPSFTDETHFAERTRRAVPSFGDLVITREAPMGLVCMIPIGLKCCLGQRMVLLRPNHDAADTKYLLYALLSEAFQRSISVAGGTGSTVSNLRIPVLKGLEIPAPPLPEQRAIATALSDVDGLLGGLDRLIAKKRDLKQAAMQQLLTGQTRLPGFHGEWEVKRLGEICEIAMGRTPPRLNQAFWGHGYKWLSIADLQTKVVSDSKEEITELAASTMTIIPKGTLLMSFKLSLGRLCFSGCDLFTNEAICSFNKLQANAEFLYYILGRTDFSLYGKQAVKGYTLNKESLKIIEVPLPPLPEQTAIATVLSEMDGELAVLEQRREKTRALKQAMMQELLTGRTRLV